MSQLVSNVENTNTRRSVLPDLDTILEAVRDDEGIGFCTACGESQYGCEPDARNYECESCGHRQVFGAAELLLRMV